MLQHGADLQCNEKFQANHIRTLFSSENAILREFSGQVRGEIIVNHDHNASAWRKQTKFWGLVL